eukprot:63562-Hanusia_phi.AAC.1
MEPLPTDSQLMHDTIRNMVTQLSLSSMDSQTEIAFKFFHRALDQKTTLAAAMDRIWTHQAKDSNGMNEIRRIIESFFNPFNFEHRQNPFGINWLQCPDAKHFA